MTVSLLTESQKIYICIVLHCRSRLKHQQLHLQLKQSGHQRTLNNELVMKQMKTALCGF